MATRRKKVETAADVEAKEPEPMTPDGTWSYENAEGKRQTIQVRMHVVEPGMSPWLTVTGRKTGYRTFVPCPIRMLQEYPSSEGGGCIVHGAHGDKAEAKESAAEILEMLGGYALGEPPSFALAT